MKEAFTAINFRQATLDAITQANAIVDEYRRQGFRLTLRQLYYQHVARDLIQNNLQSYKRLGDMMGNARLAGLTDWDSIEDRTRNVRANSHWDTPGDIINSAAYSFRLNKWDDQPVYVECWVEKDALIGIVGQISGRLDVPHFSCRGYVSLSEMYDAAKRIQRQVKRGKQVVVLHLGDHDPSGIDMTRDIGDRIDTFLGGDGLVSATDNEKDGLLNRVTIHRLALNYPQIEQYNPPPNYAKETDSRFQGYFDKYGENSWELDALEPSVLSTLIERHINRHIDTNLWRETVEKEDEGRKLLRLAASNWDGVADYLTDSGDEEE